VIHSVRDFSPRASSAVEGTTQTKFGTRVAYGIRMMLERQICAWHAHSTEKAHDTPLMMKNKSFAT